MCVCDAQTDAMMHPSCHASLTHALSQSIVAPLGSLTLVSNVILAPLLLKEKVTRRDIFCTVAIVIGSVLSVAFASHNDVNYSIEEVGMCEGMDGGAVNRTCAMHVNEACVDRIARRKLAESLLISPPLHVSRISSSPSSKRSHSPSMQQSL